MVEMLDFGSKIKSFAINNFGSVKNLAAEMGIADTSIHRYVSGDVKPGVDFLMKLKDLGCNMDWLLSTDTDPPAPTAPTLQQLEQEKQALIEENTRLRATISGELVLLSQKLKGIGVNKNSKK